MTASPAGTGDTEHLFGLAAADPGPGAPAISHCIVNHIAEGLSGRAHCCGGGTEPNILPPLAPEAKVDSFVSDVIDEICLP
jgi:hypothetical protein